jgi:hypothetical protein
MCDFGSDKCSCASSPACCTATAHPPAACIAGLAREQSVTVTDEEGRLLAPTQLVRNFTGGICKWQDL